MPRWPRPSRMPPDVHEHAALRRPQRSSGTGRECSRRPMTPMLGGGPSKPGSAISRRGTPTGRDVLLEEVVAHLPPGRERAIALTRLAWVSGFGHGFHVSADLFRDALAEIGDDPAARIEIERGLAWSIHEIGDVAAAEPHARAALELAERLGEPGVLASALADMAFFQTIRGRGIPTALIERAVELGRHGRRVEVDPRTQPDPPGFTACCSSGRAISMLLVRRSPRFATPCSRAATSTPWAT